MCAQRYCMPDPTAHLTDEIIMDQIAPGSHVVDFGCGDGRLLRRLRDDNRCSVLGVELDVAARLARSGREVGRR